MRSTILLLLPVGADRLLLGPLKRRAQCTPRRPRADFANTHELTAIVLRYTAAQRVICGLVLTLSRNGREVT